MLPENSDRKKLEFKKKRDLFFHYEEHCLILFPERIKRDICRINLFVYLFAEWGNPLFSFPVHPPGAIPVELN